MGCTAVAILWTACLLATCSDAQQPQQQVVVVDCGIDAPEAEAIPLQSFTTYALDACTTSRRFTFVSGTAASLSFVNVVANGGTALPCVVVDQGPLSIHHVSISATNVAAERVCASPWIGIVSGGNSESIGNASFVHVVAPDSTVAFLSIVLRNVSTSSTTNVNATYVVLLDTRPVGALSDLTVVVDDCTIDAAIVYYAVHVLTSVAERMSLRSNGSAWSLLGRGGLFRTTASTRMADVVVSLTHAVGRSTRPHYRGFGCPTCDNEYQESSVLQFSGLTVRGIDLRAEHVVWHYSTLRPPDVMSTHSWYFMWLTSDAPLASERRVDRASMRMEHCSVVGASHGIVAAMAVDRLSVLRDASLVIADARINLTARGATTPTTSTRTTVLVYLGHVQSSMNVAVALANVVAHFATQCGVTLPGVYSLQNQGSAQGVILAATAGTVVSMQNVRLVASLEGGYMQPYNVTGSIALGDIGASLIGLYKVYRVTNLTVDIRGSSLEASTGFGVVPGSSFLFYGMYLSTVVAVSLVGNCTACRIALHDTHVVLLGMAFQGSVPSSWVTLVCPPEPFINSLNITALISMFDVYHQVERCGFPLLPPDAVAFLPVTWLVDAHIELDGCSVRTYAGYDALQPLDIVALIVPGVNTTNASVVARRSSLPDVVLRSRTTTTASGGTTKRVVPAGPFAVVCVSDCSVAASRLHIASIEASGPFAVSNGAVSSRLVSAFRFGFKRSQLQDVSITLRGLHLGPAVAADDDGIDAMMDDLPVVLQTIPNSATPTTVHLINVSLLIVRCVFPAAAHCFDAAAEFDAAPTASTIVFGCNTRSGVPLAAADVAEGSAFLAPAPLHPTAVDVQLRCDTPLTPLVPVAVASTAAGTSMAAVAASILFPTSVGGPLSGIPALQSALGALSIHRRCALQAARSGPAVDTGPGGDVLLDPEPEAPSSNPIDNPLQLRVETFAYDLSYAGGAVLGNTVLVGAIAILGWWVSRLRRWGLRRRGGRTPHSGVGVGAGLRRKCIVFAAEKVRDVAFPGMLLFPYSAFLQPVATAAVVLVHSASATPATNAVGGIGIALWVVVAPCAIAAVLWCLPLVPRATTWRRQTDGCTMAWWIESLFRVRCTYVLPPASVFGHSSSGQASNQARAAARVYQTRFATVYSGSRGGYHGVLLLELTVAVACGGIVGAVLAAPLASACDTGAWGLWALVGLNGALLCLYVVCRPFCTLFDNLQAVGVAALSCASVLLTIYDREDVAAGVDVFLALWVLVPVALDVLHAVAPHRMPVGGHVGITSPRRMPRGRGPTRRSGGQPFNHNVNTVPLACDAARHTTSDGVGITDAMAQLVAIVELICEGRRSAPVAA